MSNRISVAHLNELQSEQKGKLRKLWNPEPGNIICITSSEIKMCEIGDIEVVKYVNDYGVISIDHAHLSKSDCLPLLDVGQMIQLLTEANMEGFGKHHIDINWTDNYTLISALWKAVKVVLGA